MPASETRPPLVPPAVAAVMLLLALLPLPFWYYELLRVVVSVTALYTAFLAHKAGYLTWAWAMAIIAVFFNPVLPTGLDRPLWLVVDAAAAVGLGGWIFVHVRRGH